MDEQQLEYEVQQLMDAGVDREKIKDFVRKQRVQPSTPQSKADAVQYLQDEGSVMVPPAPMEWGRAVASTIGDIAGGTAAGVAQLPLMAPSGGASLPLAIRAGQALGSGIGGQIYDIGESYLTKQPLDPTRQSVSAMADFGVGMVAPAAVDRVFGGLGAVKSKLVNMIRKPLTSPGARQRYDEFLNAGIKPTAGSVSGSKVLQGTEDVLGRLPGSGGLMQESNKEVIDQYGKRFGDIVKGYGEPQTEQTLGAIVKDANKAGYAKFKDTANSLYDDISQHIPSDKRVKVDRTLTFIKEQGDKYKNDPEAGKHLNRFINKWGKIIEADTAVQKTKSVIIDPATKQPIVKETKIGGELSYETLKNLRSDIGEALTDPNRLRDLNLSSAQARQMYGALSEDLKQAAREQGPEAYKAFQTANRYWKLAHAKGGPIESTERVLRTNADNDVFNLIYAEAGAKGSGQELQRIRNTVDKNTWDAISSSVLHKMGLAKPGVQDKAGEVFSPSTFLTNWNNIKPEAKAVLFQSKRHQGLAKELDNLVSVAESLKKTATEKNTSNTANMIGFTGLLSSLTMMGSAGIGAAAGSGSGAGGLAGAAGGLATMIGAEYGAAKLMTSPAFVRWLADAGTKKGLSKGVAYHMAKLPILAKYNPEIRNEIATFIEHIGVPVNMEAFE